MGVLRFPNGAVYETGAAKPAAAVGGTVSKAAVAAKAERVEKAREFRRIAERSHDLEVVAYYTKKAKELEAQ